MAANERDKRNEWDAALERWREAGFVEAETDAAIRDWEAARGAKPAPRGRGAVALSYVGVSILLIGLFTLNERVVDGRPAWMALPFGLALVSAALAWWSRRAVLAELSDCLAIVTIIMAAVGVLALLDEVGGGALAIVTLALSFCTVLVGSGMAWLARSPRAALLAALALTALPLVFVVEGDAFELEALDDGVQALAGWVLWGAFAATLALGGGAMFLLERLQRLEAGLRQWARLGASLGTAFAILALASVAGGPAIDWLALLLSWILAVWAVRRGQAELLPAAGLLLLGALVGGLSDLDSGARLGLTIAALITALQLTALERIGPRILDRLGDDWLTRCWEAALLVGGLVGAVFLAERSLELASVAVVWAVALLVAGALRQRWLEVLLGVASVYAVGFTLLIAQFESGLGEVLGVLFVGLLAVVGAIIWRRRQRGLTLVTGDA